MPVTTLTNNSKTKDPHIDKTSKTQLTYTAHLIEIANNETCISFMAECQNTKQYLRNLEAK